jgi:hypothetical protein
MLNPKRTGASFQSCSLAHMTRVIGSPSGSVVSALNDGPYFDPQRITPMGYG